MAKRPLPVSKLRERRHKRRLIFASAGFFGMLLLAAGLIGLMWMPQIRIHTIDVVGASSVNPDEIKTIVQSELVGRVGSVLPKDNILLYPQSTIQKHLLDMFPFFDNVTVQRAGVSAITVTITERKTTALWCGESPASSSPCFLLDKNGAAYAPAANFSGEVYLKYYGAISGGVVRQFATPKIFTTVTAFVSALHTAIATDTPARVLVEVEDVRVTFASGFVLLYSSKDDSADVLERLSLALTSDTFKNHRLSDFEYLDLRFGDKLYYKLK